MSGDDGLEKIGVLWKRESKKGVVYLSGEVDGRKVVIFKVRQKRSDRSPDYQVFLSRDAKVVPPATSNRLNVSNSSGSKLVACGRRKD